MHLDLLGFRPHDHRTLRTHQHLRTVVARGCIHLVAEVLTIEHQYRCGELHGRGVVHQLDAVAAGAHPGVGHRGEIEDPEKFGYINVFGRESATKHVVGVGHHLHSHTLQIAVQVAGRQEDPVTALETDPVQQQCRQYAGIARVTFAEFQHGPDFGREFLCTRTDIGHRTVQNGRNEGIEIRLGCGDPGGEQCPQTRGVRLIDEQPDEWLQTRHLQCAHQRDRMSGGPESCQRLEIAQSDQQFRLVTAVAIVADRGLQRHPAAILTLIALDRLLCAGMRLKRQRFFGREHLDHEGQHIAETVTHRGAQLGLRIGGDDIQQ